MEFFVARGVAAIVVTAALILVIYRVSDQKDKLERLTRSLEISTEQRLHTALRLEDLALELGYKFIWNSGHKPTKITKPRQPKPTPKSGCSCDCRCCGN